MPAPTCRHVSYLICIFRLYAVYCEGPSHHSTQSPGAFRSRLPPAPSLSVNIVSVLGWYHSAAFTHGQYGSIRTKVGFVDDHFKSPGETGACRSSLPRPTPRPPQCCHTILAAAGFRCAARWRSVGAASNACLGSGPFNNCPGRGRLGSGEPFNHASRRGTGRRNGSAARPPPRN
jgi:hypothetical protein